MKFMGIQTEKKSKTKITSPNITAYLMAMHKPRFSDMMQGS